MTAPACEGIDGGRTVGWVKPATVGEVQYDELMQGRLRHAVLRGVRVQFKRRAPDSTAAIRR